MRPLAIRPAVHLHLKQPQIQPHLQFRLPIVPGNSAHIDRPRLVFPSFENMTDIFRRMTLALSSAAARLGFLFLHKYSSGLGGKSLAVPILAYLTGRGKLPNVKSSQSANPTRFFRVVLITTWSDFVFGSVSSDMPAAGNR